MRLTIRTVAFGQAEPISNAFRLETSEGEDHARHRLPAREHRGAGRNGHGLDAQRQTIEELAARKGWTAEWKDDEGATGSRINPGLREALDLRRTKLNAQEGMETGVICRHWSATEGKVETGCDLRQQLVLAGGRYWDRTSDLCRVKAYRRKRPTCPFTQLR
jgi:hypothetical protein